ncbi:hypothetical protein [Marinactinospora rubrisoli]|uniref:Ribbon-helix-helix protein, CopG family n=1 Tax=Marinactinospora rubrisoli TaxID=2715399 RepID=A0ABW2KI88_9ACTN
MVADEPPVRPTEWAKGVLDDNTSSGYERALLLSAAILGKRSSTQEIIHRYRRAVASEPGPPSDLGGRARKVSVSMPEELTAAVHQRVGRGEFSRYVTEAVARQLELDLLAELADLLEAEHGRVSESLIAEAEAAWPDAD